MWFEYLNALTLTFDLLTPKYLKNCWDHSLGLHRINHCAKFQFQKDRSANMAPLKYGVIAFLPVHLLWCCTTNLSSGLQKTHLFCDRVCIGRSRLSKVDDFGTTRKRVCNFLLVINSNFGPILHRFRDTATYWLKTAYFSYPSLIRQPRSLGSLWDFKLKLTTRKLESWGYPTVKTP